VAQEFFARVLGQARSYLSDEHFTVDGTLIEAWASQKSFRAKDSEPPSNTPGTPGTPREAAMLMAWQTVQKMPATRRITLAGDKNYDTREFVATVREMGITPHVARNEKRPGGSAIDARTTQHSGYAVSQRKRKLVEQAFGWMKTIGQLKKVKLRGLEKVSGWFTFVGAAYNLMRLRKLRTAAAA